jgi:RNA polymerase sigma-70 factor (ECF subfamily)
MQADPSLVEAWQRGEEQAVHTLFDTWYPRAVRLAALSGLSLDSAQDCAQDAFVQAFKRRQQLRDPKAYPLWMHRIFTRRVLDALEVRGARREVPLSDAEDMAEDWQRRQSAQPETLALVAEQREQLWQSVQTLPPRERVAIVLRYYGDFSLREVADLMDLREGTLRVTLHRAINRLRVTAGSELATLGG